MTSLPWLLSGVARSGCGYKLCPCSSGLLTCMHFVFDALVVSRRGRESRGGRRPTRVRVCIVHVPLVAICHRHMRPPRASGPLIRPKLCPHAFVWRLSTGPENFRFSISLSLRPALLAGCSRVTIHSGVADVSPALSSRKKKKKAPEVFSSPISHSVTTGSSILLTQPCGGARLCRILCQLHAGSDSQ
ncbi:hypothetical protein GQ53DRAFT_424121 [Thozetella sp. PMI_491]|nr:hypothetical protein GQ53DRAFT_424121 [Thozetella sp. PMI_491]